MATYRGLDGFISIAGGTAVGEITSWEVDTKHDELETTRMGSVFHTYRAGLIQCQVKCMAHFDEADIGQKALLSVCFGPTPTGIVAGLQLGYGAGRYFQADGTIT